MPFNKMSMSVLPDGFQRIRLEQAREPKHPAGNSRGGYEFAVPPALNGRIDAEAWRKHRDHSRVRRFCDDGQSGWAGSRASLAVDHESGNDADDEVGFRFGEEVFVLGVYVSVRNAEDEIHVYHVSRSYPFDRTECLRQTAFAKRFAKGEKDGT